MTIIECLLNREVFKDDFTLGQFYINGEHFAYTCEDKDRHLEIGGEKIPAQTAIPRGRYRLTASPSNRFKRIMPLIKAVPHFDGIRIHGGNTHLNTEGCPLIGEERTDDGVRKCSEVVDTLIRRIMDEEKRGNMLYVTVR